MVIVLGYQLLQVKPNLTIHTDKKDHSIDSKSPEISNSDEDNFADQNTSNGSTNKNLNKSTIINKS